MYKLIFVVLLGSILVVSTVSTTAAIVESKSNHQWYGIEQKPENENESENENEINDHQHQHNHRKDKCEIEIFTRGSCFVHNQPVKPKLVFSFEGKKLTDHPAPIESPQPSPQAESSVEDVKFTQWRAISRDPVLLQRIAAVFVERFVHLMKRTYGERLRPLTIDKIQYIKLKHWGDASVYDLKIYGIEDLKPIRTRLRSKDIEQSSVWQFSTTLQADNLTAQFTVDADINQKIVIKNWRLHLLLQRCLLRAQFELDFRAQLLRINSIFLKSLDNFQLVSERLTWPFNEIVSSIVGQEKYYLRQVIELNVQKYINMTISRHFDLNDIMEKILRNETLDTPT